MDLSHNTLLGCDHGLLVYWFDSATNNRAEQMVLRDSVAYHGKYGIKGASGYGLDALNTDIGAGKYYVGGNALKKHPNGVQKLPPDNLVLADDPFWQSLDPENYSVVPGSPAAAVATTDGCCRASTAAAARAQPRGRSDVPPVTRFPRRRGCSSGTPSRRCGASATR